MLLISLLAGVFMPVNGKCLIPSGSGTRGGGYGPNGKWEEPGGLVNDGFRYRDRTTSTFLTRDPAGFIDGPNDYNHVRHNPWSAFDPVSYALGEPGTTILDDALGSDADWVSGISQGYGFGFNYLSGVFSAAWPGAINLSGLLPIDIISNPNTTSLDLTNLAESGSYTPEVSRVLQDLSQSFSNGLHDYSILSGTTQGVAAITQPETVFVKGFTAVIIAIKGLSYVDEVVRAGSKADDLIGYVASSADEGVEATAKGTAGAAGDLSGSIAGSFRNGQYSSWVAETDTVLYRATNFAQDANGPGRFFGLSRPANSMDAEMMYNLKAWGNNATELLEYRIPAGTRGYIGPVHDGTGTQLFIPNTKGVQLLDQSPLFIPELKFITP
jgi:RHS repeat-associated protein